MFDKIEDSYNATTTNNNQASIMASGDEETLKRVDPLFQAIHGSFPVVVSTSSNDKEKGQSISKVYYIELI